jgi:hypothetical protein
VTVDCEIQRICDAEDTEPFSATATKYWSWRSEKAIDETGRCRMRRCYSMKTLDGTPMWK